MQEVPEPQLRSHVYEAHKMQVGFSLLNRVSMHTNVLTLLLLLFYYTMIGYGIGLIYTGFVLEPQEKTGIGSDPNHPNFYIDYKKISFVKHNCNL